MKTLWVFQALGPETTTCSVDSGDASVELEVDKFNHVAGLCAVGYSDVLVLVGEVLVWFCESDCRELGLRNDS